MLNINQISMQENIKLHIAISIGIFALLIGANMLVVTAEKRQIKARDLEPIELSDRASYLNSSIMLATVAVPHLEEMIADAEKEGMCLVVLSGHRTNKRQWIIYNGAEDKSKVAYPGTSEHEEGLAVDLGGCPMIDGVRNDNGARMELKNDFETLPEYAWLKENAEKYGFKQSYTAENVDQTGFPEETWHWKYQYKY